MFWTNGLKRHCKNVTDKIWRKIRRVAGGISAAAERCVRSGHFAHCRSGAATRPFEALERAAWGGAALSNFARFTCVAVSDSLRAKGVGRAMADTQTLISEVEKIVRQEYENRKIVSVDIDDRYSDDSEDAVFFRIVFDDREGLLDAGPGLSLPRKLFPALAQHGEARFPIISYIGKSELKHLNVRRR